MLELANICHMPKLKALSDKYRRRVYLTVALTNTHTQNCVALKLLDTVGHIPRKCLFVNFQRMCSVAVALFVSCADFPRFCVSINLNCIQAVRMYGIHRGYQLVEGKNGLRFLTFAKFLARHSGKKSRLHIRYI